MGRKAFLAAVCLCLRWVAALGAAPAAAGGKSPGGRCGGRVARREHGAGGAGEVPGMPVGFGEGGDGGGVLGKCCRHGGKGEFASQICKGSPGCRGCCGTWVGWGGLGRRWRAMPAGPTSS